ncbi:dethiobiotin synthase [Azospirillum canadense]|uniref:dethiobiotin synthase n=1 Tax=Azospirillum canadense TaxID=403962 RepID=UPI002227EA42|nr:dethiobiotin synthase [Azospirillum canadense]MCW2240455.1 malonyl-CoA O-methyltransferase [Azospirillum canadense]
MTGTRQDAIVSAFGRAAARYEDHAAVQRAVADRLAERIATLPLPRRPRVLEIGCGTGFLSRALRARLGPADWLFTDLSAAMVARARAAFGEDPDARFLVMDGETPCAAPPGGFDLVCSSLAVQWFQDPGAALARWAALLAPGGHIAFATLAADSFREWRAAHTRLGYTAGVPAYPTAAALARLWPAGGTGVVTEERLVRHHPDGRDFLAELKGIGATLPCATHRPLPPGALRQVLRLCAPPEGLRVTHHIAYGLYRRDGAPPRGVFVTGTDTGVGKTVVSACLARAWDAAYWKPLQTGVASEPDDTTTVAALAGLSPERTHPPAYTLSAPLAPLAAAALEGVDIDLARLVLPPDAGRPLVVEGAGGLMVPVTGSTMIIDVIARLRLPVVLVARSTLGTLNHTLLSLEALRARGLPVAGVILNGPANPGNRALIERFGKVTVLAEVPPLPDLGDAAIAAAAARLPAFDALFPSDPSIGSMSHDPDQHDRAR